MKDKDKIQGGQWLISFQHLQIEAGSIIGRICPTRGISLDDNFAAFKKALEVLADSSLSDEFTAFEEALEKLPGILERMKAFTTSDVTKVRMIQKAEVNALDAFIEACILGVAWSQDLQNRGLEAAMFFRFTQAYKWWEVSDIESSAFWRP